MDVVVDDSKTYDERGLAENRLAPQIIGAAIEVQRVLGSGLVESAYEMAFCRELSVRGLSHETQVSVPVHYKGLLIPHAYRMDVVVENCVVVEIKAVECLLAVHEAQLLTCLRFADKRLGLLLNFHAMPMKSGIRRVANKL